MSSLKQELKENTTRTLKDELRESLQIDKYSSDRNPIDKMNDNIKLN